MRVEGGASGLDPKIAARLKRNDDGLVAAIAQQHDTGEVLMLAWMDDEALHRTLTTGRCTYWSRSRQEYWVKGETSGHVQRVVSVALDCDGDTVLLAGPVTPVTGRASTPTSCSRRPGATEPGVTPASSQPACTTTGWAARTTSPPIGKWPSGCSR
jgi:phosphoribosyl-AMP cyclohydrolase